MTVVFDAFTKFYGKRKVLDSIDLVIGKGATYFFCFSS